MCSPPRRASSTDSNGSGAAPNAWSCPTIRRCTNALLSVLFAAPCAACDTILDDPIRGCVCATCWSRVRLLAPPVCDRCGIPLPSARVDRLCPRCRRQQPGAALDRLRSAGLYEDSLREIIHAFKYGARRSLARPLARFMRAHPETSALLEGIDAVVPVPLHRSRTRSRGFNQARDLARALRLDAPVRVALRRVRATRPQTDLPAAQRHRNVRGAFALARNAAATRVLTDACVLLVDDVCTTGATLEACARVLKAAGVREVRAVTAARAVWPRDR